MKPHLPHEARTTPSARLRLAVMLALTLPGCAVGPSFKAPAPPAVTAYTPEPQPPATESTPVTGGEAQNFRSGGDIGGQWWTAFGSEQLDALIQTAMKNYPDIAAQAGRRCAQRGRICARNTALTIRSSRPSEMRNAKRSAALPLRRVSRGSSATSFWRMSACPMCSICSGASDGRSEALRAQALDRNFQLEARRYLAVDFQCLLDRGATRLGA